MSIRVGPFPHAQRSRQRTVAAAGAHISARLQRSPAGIRENRKVSARSALARLVELLRALSRRQRSRHRREPSNWVDWTDRQVTSAARRAGSLGESGTSRSYAGGNDEFETNRTSVDR